MGSLDGKQAKLPELSVGVTDTIIPSEYDAPEYNGYFVTYR